MGKYHLGLASRFHCGSRQSVERSPLQAHCSVHLKEGKISVFDDICQLQHLASSLAYNEIRAPTTSWNKDQTIVQYLTVQVKIKCIVSGVRSMLSALNQKMYSLSGRTPVEYTIPNAHVDNLSSTA